MPQGIADADHAASDRHAAAGKRVSCRQRATLPVQGSPLDVDVSAGDCGIATHHDIPGTHHGPIGDEERPAGIGCAVGDVHPAHRQLTRVRRDTAALMPLAGVDADLGEIDLGLGETNRTGVSAVAVGDVHLGEAECRACAHRDCPVRAANPVDPSLAHAHGGAGGDGHSCGGRTARVSDLDILQDHLGGLALDPFASLCDAPMANGERAAADRLSSKHRADRRHALDGQGPAAGDGDRLIGPAREEQGVSIHRVAQGILEGVGGGMDDNRCTMCSGKQDGRKHKGKQHR